MADADNKTPTLEEQVAQLKEMVLALTEKKEVPTTEPVACTACADAQKEVEALKVQIADLTAKLADETTEVLKDKLATSRKEVKHLHDDIDELTQQLASVQEKLREAHLDKIATFKQLSGEAPVEVKDSLKDKSTDELITLADELSGKIDLVKLSDKLNLGISKEPTETVEDPTLKTTDNTKPQDSADYVKFLEQVHSQYIAISLAHGNVAAAQYLDDLRARGLLPMPAVLENK